VTLEELRRRSLEANSKEWVWLHSHLCVGYCFLSEFLMVFFHLLDIAWYALSVSNFLHLTK
jgi:hypothetical protein